MTYTFKLARRLAISHHLLVVLALGVITACESDTTAPQGAWAAAKMAGRGRRWKFPDSSTVVPGSNITIVKMSLSPDSTALSPGATKTFHATAYALDGSASTPDVKWTATGGVVDAQGNYTAGNTPGIFKVVATSLAGTLADTAFVAVESLASPVLAQVILNPATVSLQTGATTQFLAYGRDTAGDSVGVTVSFTATGGTINSAGFYTAGQTAGSYRVIAAASGLADTCNVTLSAPSPPLSSSETKYGLHMDITYYGAGAFKTTAVQKAAAIHAKVSRNTLVWYAIEPVKGTRNWANHDDAINALVAAGIEPLLIIGSSPAWANGSSDPWVVPTAEAAFTAWLANYQTFITAAVTRYKDRVHKWELWNEENEMYFWKPAPNVAQYIRFYQMAYAAVKVADPTAEVSMGGMAGLVNGCCITGLNFLQSMYNAGVYPDIVNIHPYALNEQAPDNHIAWAGNFDDIAAIRSEMVANGQSNKPIWVTEWGWKTTSANEATVATYITKSLQMIDSIYPYVTVATYFVNVDMSGYTQGLFRSDWSAKAGATAFSNFAATH